MAFQLIFVAFFFFTTSFSGVVFAQTELNSQKIALAEPSIGPGTITGDNVLSDNTISGTTLNPQVGPLGSTLDVQNIPENTGQISIYAVHDGDTIGSVAKMFGVTKDTIIYANDLSKGQSLKTGSILAIPPVSGQIYTVKNGETIASVAKKFKVKSAEIAIYNDLDVSSDLNKGDTLIIPDNDFTQIQTQATIIVQSKVKNTTSVVSSNTNKKVDYSNDPNAGPVTAHPMRVSYNPDLGNALLRPVSIDVSRRTQGAHNNGTAVDIGAPIGTPIMAAADGVVVLARDIGWNGGYGDYVIIMSTIDGNVVQTIYAHMSEVLVTSGVNVKRGDVIGKVGKTGHATGPHLHFEVHGARNPLIDDSDYTGE